MGKKTPEELRAYKEKIKKINQILVDKYNQYMALDEDARMIEFENPPKLLTEDEINDIAEGRTDTNPKLTEYASTYSAIHEEIRKYGVANTGRKFDPNEGNDLERLAPYAFDFSFLNHAENSKEYNSIMEKNLNTLEGLKSEEKRKEFVESMIKKVISTDFKTLLTGSLEERAKYAKDHVTEVDLMFIVSDINNYYGPIVSRGEGNPELFNAFLKKKSAMVALGGFATQLNTIGDDKYQIFKNYSGADSVAIKGSTSNYEEKIIEGRELTEDQKVEREINTYVTQISVSQQSEAIYESEKNEYEFLAQKGILGSGEDNLKYEAYNENGQEIGLDTAIDRLKNNKFVEFREVNKEYINHILKGTKNPENKFTGNKLEFLGKTPLNEITGYIEEKTGVNFETAIENGYLTFGNKENRTNLFEKEKTQDVYSKIANPNENVFLTVMDSNKGPVDYKLTLDNNKPKLTEVVSQKKYDLMTEAIRVINDSVNSTGVTSRDSKEFTDFKKELNDLASKGLPLEKDKFDACINKLDSKAFDYAFAKLDQSQNKKREARFTEAFKTMEVIKAINEGKKPTVEEMDKNIIAAKGFKAILNDMKKKHPEAQNVLNNKDLFRNGVDELKNKKAFKDEFLGKTPSELRKLATKNASDLKKMMVKGKEQPEIVNELNI